MDEATRLPEIEPNLPEKSLFGSFIKMIFSGLLLLGVLVGGLLLTVPDVTELERCMTTSMFKVKLCPGGDNYVRLNEISPYLIHAVIVAEDGSFYSHKGFDWHEIQASFEANLKSGQARRGGSTLTQQLAKNVFLSQEKSLWRKIKEAYIANAIENKYDKNFILEKYLNVVEFGPKIYGVKAAAEHYFQVSPQDLHPLQAAYLAHLLPNPKVYSQGYRKGSLTPFSRKMITTILKRMEAYGKLNEDSYQRSLALMGDFPWRSVGFDSFTGAPSYSLETDVPMPKAADLEYDDMSVPQALDQTEEAVSQPEPTEPAPEEVEREVNSTEDFE